MAAESEENGLGGVVYEDALPLEWQPLASFPSSAELTHQNRANLSLLQAINVLETHHGDSEEGAALEQRVARLEYKVDLTLDLLSRLVIQQQGLPKAIQVRLGSEAAEWSISASASLPAIGSAVTVALYLMNRIPSPLTLTAEVTNVTVREGTMWICAAYHELGEETQEALIKLIFRHHRRTIAQYRAAQ